MSSLQQALLSAGLSNKAVPGVVTKRELLWSGGTIHVKIPLEATALETPDGIKYLRFPKLIKGGLVNYHLHAQNAIRYRGKGIVATVEIFRKDFADGRSFLYIDLKPANGEITHRVSVVQKMPGIVWPAHVQAFETPAPLIGAILVTDKDKKFS